VRDFGLVRQQVTQVAEFQLRNDAASPVRIDEVTSTCGCTQSQIAPRDLAPGESATLRLTLSTHERRGSLVVHSVVTYRKAACEQKYGLPLWVRATVDPDYEVIPEELSFGAGRPNFQRVVLRPEHLPFLQIKSLSVDRPFFEARLAQAAGTAGERSVEVVFHPERHYPGAENAYLLVSTDSQRQPVVRIRLSIQRDPESLVLTSGSGGSGR
jgi:hypothetical protein